MLCLRQMFFREGGDAMKIPQGLKNKLASRKLWSAMTGVAVSLCAMFGIDEMTVGQITALISAVGVLVAYIFAEGFIDASKSE